MGKRTRSNWGLKSRRQSVSALVDFALLSLPLALLLCGICQYGFIYAANMTVRNASVVAARYATVTMTNTPSVIQITAVAQEALGPMLSTTNPATVITEIGRAHV